MNRCTLRWEQSSDDGGADVRHYVLEYFRDVWNVWLKAKTTKDCQVAVDDLIPGSRSYRKPISLLSFIPSLSLPCLLTILQATCFNWHWLL